MNLYDTGGRVALVTGANKGVGRGIAARLAGLQNRAENGTPEGRAVPW
jgi:NAD(P)-dependent dehydrogenase (short-subunit alcohol dehydrogenase family)